MTLSGHLHLTAKFVIDLSIVSRPAPLQAAAMLLPCPCITWICRSFVTICSATNFFLGIFLLLPRPIVSHSPWFRKGRSGQEYGPDITLPDLRLEIAKCERVGKMHDGCRVYYPALAVKH